MLLGSHTRPLTALKFISAPLKAKHFIGQLWQLMTASNVGARTQALLACARLSDSIRSGNVLKAKLRRARLGKGGGGGPVSLQPPRVFRISYYWTTFHHYLGAWNRLRHYRPIGWFSKSRGLSASVSFLSFPPPPCSFTHAIFARSLTLVSRSLLLNRRKRLLRRLSWTIP